MKLKENVNENIITETNSDSSEKECYDITTRKRLWTRNCPRCNREIYNINKYYRNESRKKNIPCSSCGHKGMVCSEETKIKLSLSKSGKNHPMYGKHHSEESKRKIRKNMPDFSGANHYMYGKHHTEETKRKLSKSHKGIFPNKETRYKMSISQKNRLCRSIETKRKMRLSAIKRISEQRFNGGQLSPRYNSKACKFIENYGKQHGYNFQHAENGGEFFIKKLGYWVDGYDKEKNVVFEYDEIHHSNRKEMDIRRMNEIKQHLDCKFIQYDERNRKLIEF